MNKTAALLEWCKAITAGYANVNVTNFTTSWKNGMAFCALVHHFRPDLIDFAKADPAKQPDNLELAFAAAEKAGAPRMMDIEDFDYDIPDKLSIITYISVMQQYLDPNYKKNEQQRPARSMLTQSEVVPARTSPSPKTSPAPYSSTATRPPQSLRTPLRNPALAGNIPRSNSVSHSTSTITCAQCKRPIFGGKAIEANGAKYHSTCFICTKCRSKLEANNFVNLDDKIFCVRCGREAFAERKKSATPSPAQTPEPTTSPATQPKAASPPKPAPQPAAPTTNPPPKKVSSLSQQSPSPTSQQTSQSAQQGTKQDVKQDTKPTPAEQNDRPAETLKTEVPKAVMNVTTQKSEPTSKTPEPTLDAPTKSPQLTPADQLNTTKPASLAASTSAAKPNMMNRFRSPAASPAKSGLAKSMFDKPGSDWKAKQELAEKARKEREERERQEKAEKIRRLKEERERREASAKAASAAAATSATPPASPSPASVKSPKIEVHKPNETQKEAAPARPEPSKTPMTLPSRRPPGSSTRQRAGVSQSTVEAPKETFIEPDQEWVASITRRQIKESVKPTIVQAEEPEDDDLPAGEIELPRPVLKTWRFYGYVLGGVAALCAGVFLLQFLN